MTDFSPDPDLDERLASDADARPWPSSASLGEIWSEEVVELPEESREEVVAESEVEDKARRVRTMESPGGEELRGRSWPL